MRVLVLFVFFSSAFFAQRIEGFSVFVSEEKVTLKFAVKPGLECSGFIVLHSTDSLNYKEVGSDPGICGVSEESEPKSFTHANPVLNVVNYYKVRLEPRVETSNARAIFVSSSDFKSSVIAYPNPFYLSDLMTLRIANASNLQLNGFLYNQFGKAIQSVDLYVQGDHTSLSTAALNNGIYFLQLSNGLQSFTTKIIILR
jgi:hypothetical protein